MKDIASKHSLSNRPRHVLIYTPLTIVSRGGWFGSSIVFQDDAVVMLLYWRKCLSLVGERKFYGHVTAKDSQHVTIRTTLIKFEHCYWMTASLYRKYNMFSDRVTEHIVTISSISTTIKGVMSRAARLPSYKRTF